jgi:putative heme iron utilization protein
MFTITTYHDDRHHPLHGDTYAAADVAAVLADLTDVAADDVADEYGGELGDVIADLPRGCRLLLPGDMRNIKIERIA